MKIILKIDGMACGMCEAHINDVIRKNFPKAKKIKSSYRKGESSFVIEEGFNEELLKNEIAKTGYGVLSVSIEN